MDGDGCRSPQCSSDDRRRTSLQLCCRSAATLSDVDDQYGARVALCLYRRTSSSVASIYSRQRTLLLPDNPRGRRSTADSDEEAVITASLQLRHSLFQDT